MSVRSHCELLFAFDFKAFKASILLNQGLPQSLYFTESLVAFSGDWFGIEDASRHNFVCF